MQTAISVKGLRKSYGNDTAVDNLNFEVAKGEIFGLLGPNGAGKTTSIECILGTRSKDAGEITVLGMDPRRERRVLYERVGVQFQQSNYQEKIRVKEICELTASLYSNPRDYRELLADFGLDAYRRKLVSELSGGERQKLSVLLALIPNPELVFLDELTTGLDSKARRDVWNHLIKLKEKGLTILLTSHYMDEVEKLCDRVCILKKGQMLVMDTVPQLITQSPFDNFEEAYLWYTGEEKEDEDISDNV